MTRPGYQIYQEVMIKRCLGFPQWKADPQGDYENEDKAHEIRIGDVGYFSEGKFCRHLSLNGYRDKLRNPDIRMKIDTESFLNPVVMSDSKEVQMTGKGGANAGNVGAGAHVEYQFRSKAGAVLNVESKRATFRRCDEKTKQELGGVLKRMYPVWLKDFGLEENHTRILDRGKKSVELFLVTGTYMTRNWEATAFEQASTMWGGGASVQAFVTQDNNFSFNWAGANLGSPFWSCGHTHPENEEPEKPEDNGDKKWRRFLPAFIFRDKKCTEKNATPASKDTTPSDSFALCCHEHPNQPENQCIFLRGFWIKERRIVGDFRRVKMKEANDSSKSPTVETYYRVKGPRSSQVASKPPADVEAPDLIDELYNKAAEEIGNVQDDSDFVLVHDDDVIHLIQEELSEKTPDGICDIETQLDGDSAGDEDRAAV